MEKVELSGIPETLLWPLWNRARESQRPDRILTDEMAESLVETIDYGFEESFGKPTVYHAIRARVGDDLVRGYAERVHDPVVVALGEGLDGGFWRIGNETLTWHSVDVAEAVEVQERFFPRHDRFRSHALSALDPAWLEKVDSTATPFITAAGLFMYFREDEVKEIFQRIARRWPAAEIFFDTIPPGFSKRTLSGMKITPSYTAPPMPWGIGFSKIEAFLRAIPSLEPVTIQTYADPFPRRTPLISMLSKIRPLKERLAPCLVHARFSKANGAPP